MFDAVFALVHPRDINFLNRIMESYEYLGVVTNVGKKGFVMIRTTPDTYQEVLDVLLTLPIQVDIV